jgi:outer membrane protein TolC
VADAGRLSTAEASRAFYESVAADRRLEAATAILALNERLSAAALTQMGEGAISVMDANFARIEGARSRARVLGTERDVRTARLALGYLLGATPGTVLVAREEPERPLPAASEMQTEALLATAANRPDLIARQDEIDRATALARLSRRDAIPDLNLGIVVEGDDSGASPRTGLQLGLSVPIWNRSQGVTDQHEAESRRASLERDAVAARVRTEVTDALQSYAAATEEEALLADEVLAPVRANQAFLETAYQEGEIDLPSLVLLRNQLLDAEMAYWDAWLARRLSLVELERAVGTPDFD